MNNNMLMQLLKSGNNPKDIFMGMLKQMNNPVINNIEQMINMNDLQGIETVARNLCKEKGIDADNMLKNIQMQFYKR